MSIWINKPTCPGFIFCSCKLHPKGNKYHIMCCSESGIVYGYDIVHGRDNPIPMGRPEFDKKSQYEDGWTHILTNEISMEHWEGSVNGQRFLCF